MSVYLGSKKIGSSIYKNLNRFNKIVSGQLEKLNPEDFYDLEEISDYQFYYSPKLKKVELSNNIKKINQFAFYNNENLEEIYLSSFIEEIGDYSFSNCSEIKKVVLYNTIPPIIYSNTFDTILKDDLYIYIPNGTIENYRNAENWSNYADRFVEMEG